METTGISKVTDNKIVLPPIIVGPVKYHVGEAYQVLREAIECTVEAEQKINVTQRIQEKCLHLSNGEKIILTTRRKLQYPDGIHGILRQGEDGKLEWLTHDWLRNANDVIENKGIEELAAQSSRTWKNSVNYKAEEKTIEKDSDKGLRPPQLSALFAISSHWCLRSDPATVSMPTGTGKTETILAACAANTLRRTLVAVPSKALRTQTADKFLTFGLLRELNILNDEVKNPVVGILKKRPRDAKDLEIFQDCNVVVGAVPSIAGGTALDMLPAIADIMDVLIMDEAHHVAASTWGALKESFGKKRVLQFTATPFRNDKKLVDGSVISSYSLKSAQEDGYFKPIEFSPVFQPDTLRADTVIADKAIELLKRDLEMGLDHQLLARCKSRDRAEAVFKLYQQKCPELKPLLIHSEINDADERVEKLRCKESRVVICVNMLGEGVDVPSLKVAAIHDSHQSLAVLLQFVGRFTRKGDEHLGHASVVANIANQTVASSLEQLYNEDADWNDILQELSSEAAQAHAQLIAFLEGSERIEVDREQPVSISHQSLRPAFSSLFYECSTFSPKRFIDGLPNKFVVVRVWVNSETNTLYFVTRSTDRVKWTSAKSVEHVEWDLFVLHFNEAQRMLYLATTNKTSHFTELAEAVGGKVQITGEQVFRSLDGIGRLVFNNLGVTKHGRRNLSYATYTGAQVRDALSETEKVGSRKSNIDGYGWEKGSQMTIGCSRKGRVWSKAAGTLPEFIKWVENIGKKLIDDSIDTSQIIKNVMIPEYVDTIPNIGVLNIEWPSELLRTSEDRIVLSVGEDEYDWFSIDLKCISVDHKAATIEFAICEDEYDAVLGNFKLTVKGEEGYDLTQAFGKELKISIGNKERRVEEFFRDYPPLVRFLDLSELDGNVLLKTEGSETEAIQSERLEEWDWSGVDVKKESIWKKGIERKESVQWHTAQQYIAGGYDIVFDDDGANEAADLICIKEDDDCIQLRLLHCKYSGGKEGGERVGDTVEVASQAVRSARWSGQFKKLVSHMVTRNERHAGGRDSYLHGNGSRLIGIERSSRFKEVRIGIVVVQPGISKQKLTRDQAAVLGSASSYLKQTIGIDLDVICSNQ